ncbi:ADP-ribosylglycohydrolase [Streptacidiphilus sp. MAP12-20]
MTAETAAELERRDRVRGCLVGGAIGDALGWPVEFQHLERILHDHGPQGVTSLRRPHGRLAEVTDDTQMTLFTAEGLLLAGEGTRAEVLRSVHAAYQRWLRTQYLDAPQGEGHSGLATEAWLYASRAPGNACMSGLPGAVCATARGEGSGTPGYSTSQASWASAYIC